MRMVRFLIAILIATVAFSQQEKPGSVRGQVVSINGEPLRKAEVTLRSTGGGGNRGDARVMAATTDTSGGFVFENVTPGNYVIAAQRNGYVRQEMQRRGGGASMQAISVAAGQEVGSITVKLTPHSVVTGKVTDEDGEALYGANIQVMEERYMRGRRTLAPRANGTVNDLGEYRIPGLAPGRYFLAVDPRREFGPQATRVRPKGEEVERTFVMTYFPGVVEQSQATPIQLQPGQEARGIDIQLRKTQTVHVRGYVMDEAGKPAGNTSIMLINGESPTNGIGRGSGHVRPDGSFDIGGVQPGAHMLMANHMTRDRSRSVAITNVQVGARDVDNVVLRMSAPAEVSGVIRAEDNPDVKNVRITLDPMDSLPYDMYSSRAVGEGNTFTVPNVTPGSFRVDALGAPDGYYLKSVQAGGQEFLDSGIGITGSVGGLEVILAKGAVTVEGTAVDNDGKPLGQAIVALIPPAEKRAQWRLFRSAMTDQNGKFAFRNLSPGEYTLLAYGPGADASLVQNPEYLRQVESKGTVLKAAANARESVQVKVVD